MPELSFLFAIQIGTFFIYFFIFGIFFGKRFFNLKIRRFTGTVHSFEFFWGQTKLRSGKYENKNTA